MHENTVSSCAQAKPTLCISTSIPRPEVARCVLIIDQVGIISISEYKEFICAKQRFNVSNNLATWFLGSHHCLLYDML